LQEEPDVLHKAAENFCDILDAKCKKQNYISF